MSAGGRTRTNMNRKIKWTTHTHTHYRQIEKSQHNGLLDSSVKGTKQHRKQRTNGGKKQHTNESIIQNNSKSHQNLSHVTMNKRWRSARYFVPTESPCLLLPIRRVSETINRNVAITMAMANMIKRTIALTSFSNFRRTLTKIRRSRLEIINFGLDHWNTIVITYHRLVRLTTYLVTVGWQFANFAFWASWWTTANLA